MDSLFFILRMCYFLYLFIYSFIYFSAMKFHRPFASLDVCRGCSRSRKPVLSPFKPLFRFLSARVMDAIIALASWCLRGHGVD